MERLRTIKILTAYCAAQNDVALFTQIIMMCEADLLRVVETDLRRLQAVKLLRILSRNRISADNAPSADLPDLFQEKDTVYLSGKMLGKTIFLYRSTTPHEVQARIASEIFFETFFDLLAQSLQILLLNQSEMVVEIFVPGEKDFQLDSVWGTACEQIFGIDNLRRTFVALMNSVKLTNRGFSALDVPIVNHQQAQILAAFNLHNLESLQKGDDRRRKQIVQLDNDQDEATNHKDKERIGKNRDKIAQELETREDRYGPLYAKWGQIREERPMWSGQVRILTREFSPIAATQISKAGAKIGRAVGQIEELAKVTESGQMYVLPLLLSYQPQPQNVRPGGDSNTKVCYSCGSSIEKGAPVFQANTFIFASPSQRLQSGGSQTQPNVCGACAALSFVSPIKLGEGRLVVRLHLRGYETSLMLDEQLRMLALGEMNVVAGRYALLQANERIGNDSIIDKLGGVQYAIYKVGSLFPPEVFEGYAAEITVGESRIILKSRHLAWMNRLSVVFNLKRYLWNDKGEFAAFGRAIRYLEKDEVIFAIYELLKQNMVTLPLNRVRAVQLETLRSEQIRWLTVDKEHTKAEFYRDVAGMTGLLYAFCNYVKGQFTGNEQRIEVRKLIERTTDPNQFIYTAAGNTGSEMATLYRSEDMHFSFDEVRRLLEWIGVDVDSREDRNDRAQPTLKLYLDDVVKAYTQFFETKYTRTKDQRDFIYALQLSLHARFPELIERKKENE